MSKNIEIEYNQIFIDYKKEVTAMLGRLSTDVSIYRGEAPDNDSVESKVMFYGAKTSEAELVSRGDNRAEVTLLSSDGSEIESFIYDNNVLKHKIGDKIIELDQDSSDALGAASVLHKSLFMADINNIKD